MNDELLKLFAGSIIAAGVFAPQQPGRFLGRNRTYNAVPRIGGDVTGTSPTFTFVLEECATLAGTYVQVPGTGTINVTEMWGLQQTGGSAAAGAKPEIPRVAGMPPRVGFTTTKDYVRAVVTGGGTGPSFPNATIYAEPTDVTNKISGS